MTDTILYNPLIDCRGVHDGFSYMVFRFLENEWFVFCSVCLLQVWDFRRIFQRCQYLTRYPGGEANQHAFS